MALDIRTWEMNRVEPTSTTDHDFHRDPAAPERVRDHLRRSDELIVAEISRLRATAGQSTQSTRGEIR